MKAWEHLKTINHHKEEVMKNCFRVGMYKQGLLHDLSKYNPKEFFVGCKYYQGNRSPNAAEREERGYSSAWLHHKGRNKHHFEYWIDVDMDRGFEVAGMRMPVKYVLEMFMDRIAASKTYQKEKYTDASPLEYYNKTREVMVIHPKTRRQLEILLGMLARDGEEETFRYIREHIIRKRGFGGGK
ncbi:MAG: catalase [Lachnospiraceae bacterium]|nr:catalase [Lachnospiraceae bacterium]